MLSPEEVSYLQSQRLARLATVDQDSQPDVVPVVFEFDGTNFFVGGRQLPKTRKYRNVVAGSVKVSLVVADLAPSSGWAPRFVRIYGTATAVERVGAFDRGEYLKITPSLSWSWNLDGRPYGPDNNSDIGLRRTVHARS